MKMSFQTAFDIVQDAAKIKANEYGYKCFMNIHEFKNISKKDYSFCFIKNDDLFGTSLRSITLSEDDIFKMAKDQTEKRIVKFLDKIDKILSSKIKMVKARNKKGCNEEC